MQFPKIHFTREEFECECGCGFNTLDYYLIEMLEGCRTHFQGIYGKVKVVVTGGNRCNAHNEEIQKKYVKNYVPFSSNSVHKKAQGADHKVYYFKDGWVQVDSDEVYDYYDKKYPSSCGLGKYGNRTHCDPRNYKARWVG
ncbi:MAG: hypothetical protein Q9M40_07105 [Sulfurimonas sp.]|nr:hypothetical protein [Sulfurimonas sp.]MDQ7067742.1 hypothetical protein [Sulfurimonas sp.]